MKHLALVLGCAAPALAACSPSLAELRRDLDSASGTDEVAEAVRALIFEKGERGKRAVLEFDARRPDFAFDAERSVCALFDASTGSLWCVRAATSSSRTALNGIEAADFSELVRTETPRGPLFVARLASGSEYRGILYKADGPPPGSWIIYDVDAETLSPLPFEPPEDG